MADHYSSVFESTQQDPMRNAHDLLNYDKDTGVFTWKKDRRGTAKKGMVAGHTDKNGYAEIFLHSKKYHAHHLAWWFTHGEFPNGVVDHINHNPSDNRICNLRVVSNKINRQNTSLSSKANKTQMAGVEQLKSGYRVCIETGDKRYKFGVFKTIDEARASYFTAKKILHEGFADSYKSL